MEVYSNKDVSTIISKINLKKELPFLPQEVWELIFRLKHDLENREIYEFMMFNHDPNSVGPYIGLEVEVIRYDI